MTGEEIDIPKRSNDPNQKPIALFFISEPPLILLISPNFTKGMN
jgi:hypothetical protein